MLKTKQVYRLLKLAAGFCVLVGAGVSPANACLENMDIVKTTTTLIGDGDYDAAYEYSLENFDVCPAQARFFAAQLIIEGRIDTPVCEAVAMLEEALQLNNERNPVEFFRDANEKSILQLLNWAYLERYVEFSMIEGSAFSLELFLRANQDRFKDVVDATGESYYSHTRLKQLLTYAEQLDVDLAGFPQLLELAGQGFERDDHLLKSGWPKKLLCNIRSLPK